VFVVRYGSVTIAPMDENPIGIEVKNLTKRYSARPGAPFALKNLSFQVPMGKICCFLGPNGSGKTTLLKILAGLVKPSSGSISILGLDPVKKRRELDKKIGWMPAEERSGFYGRLTGKQNLQFFAALYQVPPGEFDRILGNLSLRIGIKDEVDLMMLKASAGERQKLGLVRTLFHNPLVLLLDEPLRNLDPHTLLRLRRFIKFHLAHVMKKTILLSTHLLEEARKMADIIIFLKAGEIVKSIETHFLEKELKKTTLEKYYLKVIDG